MHATSKTDSQKVDKGFSLLEWTGKLVPQVQVTDESRKGTAPLPAEALYYILSASAGSIQI